PGAQESARSSRKRATGAFLQVESRLDAGGRSGGNAAPRGTPMSISRKNFLRGSALAAGALVLSKKSVAEEPKAATAAAKPPPGPPPPNAVHFPVLKPSEFDGKKMMAILQQK